MTAELWQVTSKLYLKSSLFAVNLLTIEFVISMKPRTNRVHQRAILVKSRVIHL
jgi:hypothetical protein